MILGAPADNIEPPEGVEQHTPVLFLDLNSDDLSTGYAETGEVPVYGTHSILPKEHGAKFFALPVVRHLTNQVGAIATWDSSIHDSVCLNTVSSGVLIFTILGRDWVAFFGSTISFFKWF